MSQSLALNLIHLVYSTRDRRPILDAPWRGDLYAISVSVLQQLECPVLTAGGTDDHVHILMLLSENQTLRHVVRTVKSTTSKWINENGLASDVRFEWQGGYAAFSVSQSMVPKLRDYIAAQEEHHRRMSFQDELRAMLDKHGVRYDERFLWE